VRHDAEELYVEAIRMIPPSEEDINRMWYDFYRVSGDPVTMGVVGVPSGAVPGGRGADTSNRTAGGDGKF
jgi:hypothetical protein